MMKNCESLLRESYIITLSNDQSVYLTKVMRIFSKGKRQKMSAISSSDKNDEIDLSTCIRAFDGLNGEWLCQVIDPILSNNPSTKSSRRIKQSTTTLEARCIIKLREQDSSFTNYPWLFFAPIKKQRAKILVEKCTELGISRFYPIVTDHTDPSASEACVETSNENVDDPLSLLYSNADSSRRSGAKDLDKLSAVALEAAEQSEQLSVPIFTSWTNSENGLESNVECLLQEWKSFTNDSRALFICRERTEERQGVVSLMQALNVYNEKSVAFLIGPEGGWSKREEALFDEYCKVYPESIIGISLGSNILRAETAGITAIAGYNLWNSAREPFKTSIDYIFEK
jgi:16S rRNA (uracil1498-N3)-methyltransferase